MQTGRLLRLRRFFAKGTRKGLIVPIDHGLTMGPLEGIQSPRSLVRWIKHPAITGLIMHKGMLERLVPYGYLDSKGVMVHLTGALASETDPDTKQLLTRVEYAATLGADAVSLQLNFRADNSGHNLTLLGKVAEEGHQMGLPVLVMVYNKGVHADAEDSLQQQRHLVRACIEVGADALKIAFPPAHQDLEPLLADVAEDTPIFFAGGSRTTDESLLSFAEIALQHHAAGFCIGRNIFQHEKPRQILDQLEAIIYRGEHLSVAAA
jgi:class I fructose-bisphosphate aldolase